jgi:hypothetical protein
MTDIAKTVTYGAAGLAGQADKKGIDPEHG